MIVIMIDENKTWIEAPLAPIGNFVFLCFLWQRISRKYREKINPDEGLFFHAYIVMLLLPVAGWAQNKGYELGVGRLVVSSTNWDAASTADFQVRLKRRDPAVEKKIGALTDRIDQIQR